MKDQYLQHQPFSTRQKCKSNTCKETRRFNKSRTGFSTIKKPIYLITNVTRRSNETSVEEERILSDITPPIIRHQAITDRNQRYLYEYLANYPFILL